MCGQKKKEIFQTTVKNIFYIINKSYYFSKIFFEVFVLIFREIMNKVFKIKKCENDGVRTKRPS